MSVITPTHDPEFLSELFLSLKKQTLQQWEWVVVPNGQKKEEIVELLSRFEDKRIVVKPVPDWHEPIIRGCVGALKSYAFHCAQGDVLVEVDHDDTLHEECLRKVAEACENRDELFVFTRSLVLNENATNEVYHPRYGWDYEVVSYNGRYYHNPVPFSVSPRSLYEIYWAPNHVRAWTRKAYLRAGGHDPLLPVADDHDLLCRTYCAGIEFFEIPEVLYYQRKHKNNTHKHKANEITQATQRIGEKYLHAMIQEWCRRQQLPIIQLVTPQTKKLIQEAEFTISTKTGEVVALENLHMLTDASVGCICATDFLHKIPPGDVAPTINCIYKKLAPSGWFVSATPSTVKEDNTVNPLALSSLISRSFWCPHSFRYFTERELAQQVDGLTCRFQAVRTTIKSVYFDGNSYEKQPYVFADLLAIKDNQRIPGEIRI
ncbi:MAG: glycosyltransferase [Candidatus Caldarchaeum sp.]